MMMFPKPDVLTILLQYLPKSDYLQLYAGEHPICVDEKLRLFAAALDAKQDNPSPSALRLIEAFIKECLGEDIDINTAA
jgi:hypothetical protein